MRIAIAGGTGWTGRRVAAALRARGDEPVVLARSAGVDLITGEGLDRKLDGVEAVIDVSNITTTRAKAAVSFFETATAQLLAAGRRAGVAHHVALSIVGVDRVGLGYYRGKRRQEELVLEGPVPGTVLRATQFHEFAAQMLDRRGPVVIAPKMLSQPVALTEVAGQLAALAHGRPMGMAPELAGPEEHLWMQDMVRRLARVRHERRPVIRLAMPGKVGKGLAGGDLLPTGPGPRGTVTFDAWLATQRPDAAESADQA
ncbi:3-beta hydroxysteroid dehydrogenase [Streptomyces sp. SID10853]|uniref:SDR family oxidoreductase n=1 Tax=Streptomyces sp. SID10853 TaxID=2706028 RepID=UPI0013BF46A8|nr:3-beta hydroxysteroid dehydrogenase [Streptomyces sp. SID10853]NDZ77319.1 3-beta hydroxysteroid dehydrogenase [Streptomyces sp. SID10853]